MQFHSQYKVESLVAHPDVYTLDSDATLAEALLQTDDFVSDKERERLAHVAKGMTERLLETTDMLGGVPWRLVHERHGMSLFRADCDVPCNVHAVSKFSCNIEDVAESMITNTTESYKKMMGLLSSDFLDGAVLENILEPTPEAPHRYVSLKWAAYKSPRTFTKDRDLVMLEYVDLIEDANGQKAALRVTESVDLPNDSRFSESSKYCRDVVPLFAFMCHETKKPGELRLSYTCSFAQGGDLPAWAANSAIQSHVDKSVNGFLKYVETFRAHQESIVLPQQAIPVSELDHCRICEKSFCVLRRKYNCLKCGQRICSSCSSLRNARVPDVGERQLRVCTACVLEARSTSRQMQSCDTSSVHSSDLSPSSSVKSMKRIDSARKRRSYDDLMDSVKKRLNEYKMFSEAADTPLLPKASFPHRSFSDGLVKCKGSSLFASRRRGSPADLAISIEAFRQYKMRNSPESERSVVTQSDDYSDLGTDDSGHLSSIDSPTVSPCSSDDLSSPLPNVHLSLYDEDAMEVFECARKHASGIIEQARLANKIAQRARRLSKNRIQMYEQRRRALDAAGILDKVPATDISHPSNNKHSSNKIELERQVLLLSQSVEAIQTESAVVDAQLQQAGSGSQESM